jgi:SAM-dependent methyltransferase
MTLDPQLLTLLRCPLTRQKLVPRGDDALVTEDGSREWPVVLGIPDFRLFDPPYMSRAKEEQIARRIAQAHAAGESYDRILEPFEREWYMPERPPRKKESGLEHRRTLRERSPKRLDQLLAAAGTAPKPGGTVLDLGCGSGEATRALWARGAGTVLGLDISLVELALARVLLAEEGVAAHLVAGVAEALPFADASIDFIYSPDVIEHVSDQRAYLTEARRALKRGGELVLNSPNRFSVVNPEPHNGVWFFGFVPRPLMDPASRLIGRGPYTGKRLVSLGELRRLAADIFPDHRIEFRRANPNATSLPGKLFAASRPWTEEAYARVCDQHVLVARV